MIISGLGKSRLQAAAVWHTGREKYPDHVPHSIELPSV